MREILFKGKRKDNGEWFEGCCIKRRTGESYKYYIHDGLYDAEVIPETVGQFTGLLDKNGTKIFEGDICEGNTLFHAYKELFTVMFVDGQFVFRGHRNSDCDYCIENTEKIHVVGKIHDKEKSAE